MNTPDDTPVLEPVTIRATELDFADVAPQGKSEIDKAMRAIIRRVVSVMKYAEGECNCRPAIVEKAFEVRRYMDRLLVEIGDMQTNFDIDGYSEIADDPEGLRLVGELENMIRAERTDKSWRGNKPSLGDMQEELQMAG